MMNRRSILAGVAVASLPTVASAAAPDAPLAALIEAHRIANERFNHACRYGDDRHMEADTPEGREWQACNNAERAAMDALCAYVPQTLHDARARAAYMVRFVSMGACMDYQLEALTYSSAGEAVEYSA